MKKDLLVIFITAVSFAFSTQAFATTYLPEDAARGGMWANVLVDASSQYKNADGSFKTGGGWSDAHNLLGPIPTTQDPYAPVHTSIVTMTATSWVELAFADSLGNLLQVNNDPTNPEGYDGIVWGNAFYSGGKHSTYSEPGTIYLSQDGTGWWKLPFIAPNPYYSGKNQTFDGTPGEGNGLVYPGEAWIFDSSGNKIGETGYAGGDAFDMSTAFFVGNWAVTGDEDPSRVGLDWFTYMIVTGQTPVSGGPDCDSMYVFSTSSVPIPGAVWLLGSGLLGLLGIRRRMQF